MLSFFEAITATECNTSTDDLVKFICVLFRNCVTTYYRRTSLVDDETEAVHAFYEAAQKGTLKDIFQTLTKSPFWEKRYTRGNRRWLQFLLVLAIMHPTLKQYIPGANNTQQLAFVEFLPVGIRCALISARLEPLSDEEIAGLIRQYKALREVANPDDAHKDKIKNALLVLCYVLPADIALQTLLEDCKITNRFDVDIRFHQNELFNSLLSIAVPDSQIRKEVLNILVPKHYTMLLYVGNRRCSDLIAFLTQYAEETLFDAAHFRRIVRPLHYCHYYLPYIPRSSYNYDYHGLLQEMSRHTPQESIRPGIDALRHLFIQVLQTSSHFGGHDEKATPPPLNAESIVQIAEGAQEGKAAWVRSAALYSLAELQDTRIAERAKNALLTALQDVDFIRTVYTPYTGTRIFVDADRIVEAINALYFKPTFASQKAVDVLLSKLSQLISQCRSGGIADHEDYRKVIRRLWVALIRQQPTLVLDDAVMDIVIGFFLESGFGKFDSTEEGLHFGDALTNLILLRGGRVQKNFIARMKIWLEESSIAFNTGVAAVSTTIIVKLWEKFEPRDQRSMLQLFMNQEEIVCEAVLDFLIQGNHQNLIKFFELRLFANLLVQQEEPMGAFLSALARRRLLSKIAAYRKGLAIYKEMTTALPEEVPKVLHKEMGSALSAIDYSQTEAELPEQYLTALYRVDIYQNKSYLRYAVLSSLLCFIMLVLSSIWWGGPSFYLYIMTALLPFPAYTMFLERKIKQQFRDEGYRDEHLLTKTSVSVCNFVTKVGFCLLVISMLISYFFLNTVTPLIGNLALTFIIPACAAKTYIAWQYLGSLDSVFKLDKYKRAIAAACIGMVLVAFACILAPTTMTVNIGMFWSTFAMGVVAGGLFSFALQETSFMTQWINKIFNEPLWGGYNRKYTLALIMLLSLSAILLFNIPSFGAVATSMMFMPPSFGLLSMVAGGIFTVSATRLLFGKQTAAMLVAKQDVVSSYTLPATTDTAQAEMTPMSRVQHYACEVLDRNGQYTPANAQKIQSASVVTTVGAETKAEDTSELKLTVG